MISGTKEEVIERVHRIVVSLAEIFRIHIPQDHHEVAFLRPMLRTGQGERVMIAYAFAPNFPPVSEAWLRPMTTKSTLDVQRYR